MKRHVCRRALLVCLLLLACGAARAATAAGDRIRASAPDREGAVEVRGVELDLGAASLLLEEGVLVPDTHRTEIAFVGRARMRLVPPDSTEAAQLELFTGKTTLDEEIDRAVIVIGSPDAASRLLAGRPAVAASESRVADASGRFEAWRQGPVRRAFRVEPALVAAAAGDAAYRGFFAAWCHSEELGDFHYFFDPTEPEQILLGKFVAAELDDRERTRAEKGIRHGQKEGRFKRLAVEDLGSLDTWISVSETGADGQPTSGHSGFEPRHYTIAALVMPQEQTLEARATIDVTAHDDDRRVLMLELHPDLEVRSIVDGEGRELSWERERGFVHVVLAEPSRTGAATQLVVIWGGVVLDRLEHGVFRLRDTTGWYPRLAGLGRATYDLNFRWPRKYGLLASGRVETRKDEGDMVSVRRRVPIPVFAVSFEVGDFEIYTDRVGDVDLTFAVSKTTLARDKRLHEHVRDVLKEALATFERDLGDYPLDHLTVVTVSREFSQGLAGFITLSHLLMLAPVDRWDTGMSNPWLRELTDTVAHELAHQWWGNKVGWASYRDQWLSEALASFSALTFVAQREGSRALSLADHGDDWKSSLSDGTADGRSIESLGPVVLGTRLSSSKSPAAYSAIVYDKGAVVFRMLARLLGEEPFLAMLRSLADAVGGRVIETGTFLRALEHMSGMELDWFARQFVYGTGVPELYYDHAIRPTEEGGWIVEGRILQERRDRSRHRLERTEEGRWRLRRLAADAAPDEGLTLVVPFQIQVAGGEAMLESRQGKALTTKGLGGNLIVRGESTDFRIPVDREPERFWLDQRGEVLAWFYDERRYPRYTKRLHGDRLLRRGQYDDALDAYREALAAPSASVEDIEDLSPRRREERERLWTVAIHLGMAEALLELDRDLEARAALDQAQALSSRLDQWMYVETRTIRQARLELRAGDARAAYSRFESFARLDFPYRYDESIADAVRRRKFSGGRTLSAEGYAVMAAAAWESGHREVASKALEHARERGADVEALARLVESRGSDPATASRPKG